MQDSYLEYVEKDEQLWQVIQPMLPQLRALSAQQLETLVFYLKSLQGYYPASANESRNGMAFETKLDAIRNSTTQNALLAKARWRLRLGVLVSVAAGFLLLPCMAGLLAGEWKAATVWGLPALALFLLADLVGFRPAIDKYKEQDRRYFLESIRAARACNELDWTGLFNYNGVTMPGPQSDEAIRQTRLRIAEFTHQLRTALYNDEYMAYSRPRG